MLMFCNIDSDRSQDNLFNIPVEINNAVFFHKVMWLGITRYMSGNVVHALYRINVDIPKIK